MLRKKLSILAGLFLLGGGLGVAAGFQAFYPAEPSPTAAPANAGPEDPAVPGQKASTGPSAPQDGAAPQQEATPEVVPNGNTTVAATPASPDAGTAPQAPVGPAAPVVAAPETDVAAGQAPATPADSGKKELPGGMRRLCFTIRGSLYESVSRAAADLGYDSKQGDIIAAHIKRLLLWDMKNLARDIMAGDKVTAVFMEDQKISDGFQVMAMRFASQKLRKTIEAFYFTPRGEAFGAWYDSRGRDVAKTMKNAPVRHYEVITALLGDGRNHKGVDFKAPVGTPVYTPFKARVVRRNWNSRGNGNCLELRYVQSGAHALFLHLDTIEAGLKEGVMVEAGKKIGTVGNTGRSYAAHLHYQVEEPKDTVKDPFAWHGGGHHRQLEGADLAAFRESLQRYLPFM